MLRIAGAIIALGLSAGNCIALGAGTLEPFSTSGHTIYHLRCGRVERHGQRVLMAAALDGTVSCYGTGGTVIWENQANRGMPLDLDVADIDGDDRDETLVASADGNLYVLDHHGNLLWQFSKEPPLLQVCVVHDKLHGPIVLAGGIEKRLYTLSPDGEVRQSVEFPYIVRHIRAGNFLGDGRQYVAVVTAKNDRSRFFLQLYDPVDLAPVWDKPVGLATENPSEGTEYHVPWLTYRVAVFCVLAADVNDDGCDEVLLSDHFEKRGIFYALDYRGRKVLTSSAKGIRGRPYRMNLLARVRSRSFDGDRICGLFGNQLIVYRLDGSIDKILDSKYSLACLEFDSESNTLYLGSSVSGGDGIYALQLDQPDWESAFEQLRPVGRLAHVERNIAILSKQVERFRRPSYQLPPKRTVVITGKSRQALDDAGLNEDEYDNVEFVQFNLFTEDYDRQSLDSPWDRKRETRHKYNFKAEEIIKWAADRERLGEPFALWAGHGNDPFYMQFSTIQGILNAAPTMARALVFPEMERTDDAMQYAVRTHLIPIAELCRAHGAARVVLRNKNIFWNASCYLDLWRESLLGGHFSNVFIPSMEETNGRTQAISLSGRVGLWLCGYFEQMSARAVTDNANYSRLWEWSSQQKLTHLWRSLAFRASLGADLFLVNVYQGDPRDMTPFYRMIDKGILAIPAREELLSVSDVCLGMRQPSPVFLEHGKNGHNINRYESGAEPAVFDRLDCFWGGAPTLPHDFSRYAMGSQRRMLNFLPTCPYGFIASVPADTDVEASPFFESMLVSDGEKFYDGAGEGIGADVYKPRAVAVLSKSAERLPVRVVGDVAWSVTRLDSTHVRVTLIDPGYLSPADRSARIVLQKLRGIQCRDILRDTDLPLNGNVVPVIVPAGILTVVDVTHR